MATRCELIGAGEESLVFRRGDIVIKRLYTSKTLEEVIAIQRQARSRVANPDLEAAWPEDYICYRGVVFMIQRYVPGVTAEEIMASATPPQAPIARRIYEDRENYWNDKTLNGSYLARLVSGGVTVEQALAAGKVVYDYGPENFRLQDDDIVVVDVSFLGIPDVARELRDSTALTRKERIAVLRDRFLSSTRELLDDMKRRHMFDKYEDEPSRAARGC
jgi:hypothetical protein